MFTTICGELKRTTDKAFLINEGTKDVWVPKSVIEDLDDSLEIGKTYNFEIKTWFCEKEGLV